MNALVVIYVLLHVILCVAVGWLLVLRQTFAWRLALGLIQSGVLWNLAGLIWLGYDTVWPGELVTTGGFCLAILGLLFLRNPLVTRRNA
jgi:hypothetical protein